MSESLALADVSTGERPSRRTPLSKDDLARLIARDIEPGSFVNLGIGQPTSVSNHLRPEQNVTLHTENGMLGMGREARGEEVDDDLINAGKIPVTELPGASYFRHGDSFGMMRGGHLDVCVMGAFQVSTNGDLANWSTGAPDAIPAVGGAVDLAIGARQTWVMMTLFAKDGSCKIVPELTFPATGRDCVSRIYTPDAVFVIEEGRTLIRETYGCDPAELRDRMGVDVGLPHRD